MSSVPMKMKVQIIERASVPSETQKDIMVYEAAETFAMKLENELNNGWQPVSFADYNGAFTEVLLIKRVAMERPAVPKMPPTEAIPVVVPPDTIRNETPA